MSLQSYIYFSKKVQKAKKSLPFICTIDRNVIILHPEKTKRKQNEEFWRILLLLLLLCKPL